MYTYIRGINEFTVLYMAILFSTAHNEDLPAPQCSIFDDQRKINVLLLRAYRDSQEHNSNTTQWHIPPHALDRDLFWKQSISGHWGLTGHTFKVWDTAYRGPMPLTDDQCPGHK